MPSYQILQLDGSNAAAAAAAALHSELLPHSPVATFGLPFLEHFYYRVLPIERLICGAIAFVDNEPAGFIAATADSDGFLRTALSRRPLAAALAVARACVVAPSRITNAFDVLRIMRGRERHANLAGVGELLSFGVVPRYRQIRVAGEFASTIPLDLFRQALVSLRARNVVHVRSLVDRDNRAARIFYGGMGWIPGTNSIPGWRTPQVEYLYSLAPEAPQAAAPVG